MGRDSMIQSNRLLDMDPTVGQRAERCVWKLLSRANEVIGEVTPEEGVSITTDTSATIIRSARGITLLANDARDIDMFRDRLMPVWELEDGSGDPELGGWPLGVFLLASHKRARPNDDHVLHQATLMDAGFQLNFPLGSTFSMPDGGLVYRALVQLVEEGGITDYAIEYTDQRVKGPQVWQLTTTRVQTLRDLCVLAGYHWPYFDLRGRLVIRRPTPLEPGLGHVYATEGVTRLDPDATEEDDHLLDAPNVFVVYNNGVTTHAIAARADVDPRLPHSFNSIGYYRPKPIPIQGVNDTEHAQRIADAYAAQHPAQLRTVAFSSAVDPRHDTFDVITYGDTVYRETKHEIVAVPGGKHSHYATRQIHDPDIDQ